MSQASIEEINPVRVEEKAKIQSSETKNESNDQPNVRHIPIFVEGRDEPIINRNININPEVIQKPSPPINDVPQSIFSRVRNIPVRKPTKNFEIPVQNVTRCESPTIPIKVEHTAPKSIAKINQSNENRSRSSSPMAPPKPTDSITKIQQIQKEIIELMKKVEDFKATSRKDKEYIYLDEMLTQNLLKLDTIDTEGKENIKAARKEAINCINKCIAVLEAKVEQGGKDAASIAINSSCSDENLPNSESGKIDKKEINSANNQ